MSRRQEAVMAVVLAGGHGNRMKPISRWLPKPLVPVNGEPILVTNLSRLAACGFRKVVVVYGSSTAIPDLIESIDLPGLGVLFAPQPYPRGTADAMRIGMSQAPEAEHYLLMAGDTVYSEPQIAAVWDRFSVGDVDGCLLLKELPTGKLSGSSLVSLREDGTIAAMLSRPTAAEACRARTRLADASLQLYRRTIGSYLDHSAPGRSGELEMTSALIAWLNDGARIAGVIREAPTHVTGAEDFIIHNVSFGRRLVVATEIEQAVTDDGAADKDISGYVRMVRPEDLAFVYRRLKRLAERPATVNHKARVLAIISELFRHQATAEGSPRKAQLDELLASCAPGEAIARLEHLPGERPTDPTIAHYLAVAYGRHANDVVGKAVLQEALTRAGAPAAPGAFRERVRVKTPARLAFSSSQGSDISYIIEDKGAVMLNAAILVNGVAPGTITVERTAEPRIELVSEDVGQSGILCEWGDVFGQADPSDPLILLKAGVRFSGVLNPEATPALADWLGQCGGGFRVTVGSLVPKGSGLGCSGTLVAGVVRGLRELAGFATSPPELLARSYCCERTYGRSGYQDIIGGSWGGAKLIEADSSTGLFNPRIEQLDLDQERLDALRERLVVFYTGRPRMSHPYLLTIPAKYFTRSSDYMYAYENGKRLTRAMKEALERGDWEALGGLVQAYWDDREYFEPGVTPENARRFRAELVQWCHGTALCGSGYGGYMMAVTRQGMRDSVLAYLAGNGIPQSEVLDFGISQEGALVEVV